MAKIFSWKIDSNNYGYLYIDGNRHISEKITDTAKLNYMVAEMKTWDAAKAEEEFKKMADEVRRLYPNKSMAWSEDYWKDGGEDSSLLILNNSNNNDAIDEAKVTSIVDGFMNDVESRLLALENNVNEANEGLKNALTAKIDATLGDVNDRLSSAISEMNETRDDLINKLEGAASALTDASSLFKINDSNIDADKIKNSIDKIDSIDVQKIDQIDDIIPIIPSFSGITDQIDDINDKIDDYDNYKGKVDSFFDDDDKPKWQGVVDDWSGVYDRLKEQGYLDQGPDNDTYGVMSYFSNTIASVSGTLSNVKTITDSNRITINNIDNVVSGKVQTIVSASLQEINNNITSLSGRVQSMEMEQHSSGGNSGGGNGNAGSEMTQSSDTIAQNGGNFTQTNGSGFSISMADSAITISNGSCDFIIDSNGIQMTNGTDSLEVKNSGGIWLSGTIHMSGTLWKDGLLEGDSSH